MANEKKIRKRVKKPRQEWNPHWIIKLLYTVFSVALSAFKIAVGAAVTVALILIVFLALAGPAMRQMHALTDYLGKLLQRVAQAPKKKTRKA